MTPQELIELRKAGAKSVELNEAGTLIRVEFYPADIAESFAAAVDGAQESAELAVLNAIEDEDERKKVAAKLREKTLYFSSE